MPEPTVPVDEPAKPGEVVTEDTPQEDIDKLVNDELGIDEPAKDPEEEKDDEGDEKLESDEESTVPDVQSPPTPDEEPEEPAVSERKPAEDEVSPKTDDLFIEVEDSEGKTHKLTLEKGIPEKFTFTSDKQLFEVLQAFQEMKDLKAERENEIETKKQTQAEKQAETDKIASWDSEIEDLMEAGLIDRPKAKPGTDDFKEDPTVKRVQAVMQFMTKENEKRLEDKRSPIESFGTAFSLYQKAEADKKEKEEDKADNDAAKKAGSKVGGGSAASGTELYIYEPGKYKSIYEVPV